MKKLARWPVYFFLEKLNSCTKSKLMCINEVAAKPIDRVGRKLIGSLLVAMRKSPIKKTIPNSAKVRAYIMMTVVMYP